MNTLPRFIITAIVGALPSAAFAADGLDTTKIAAYTTGSNGIVGVINKYLVPLIFTIALIVFLYGVARAYVFSGGSESERAKGHQLILWSIIGFAVMLSVWGLVNLLTSTFNLSSSVVPKPPTI